MFTVHTHGEESYETHKIKFYLRTRLVSVTGVFMLRSPVDFIYFVISVNMRNLNKFTLTINFYIYILTHYFMFLEHFENVYRKK